MRNRVLADALVAFGGYEEALVSACVHADNDAAGRLPVPVLGKTDVADAFTGLVSPDAFTRLDPADVVAAVVAVDPSWAAWGHWVCGKYLLKPTPR